MATKKATGRAFRLATHTRPHAYEVHVEVDPAHSKRFAGRVHIALRTTQPVDRIELHAADLKVSKPQLEKGKQHWRGTIVPHPERETVEVRFHEALPRGKATLSLAFSGTLRDDLRGLYFARSEAHRYAFTQLEAPDARRFFPCFDEPSLKARFTLHVTTARDNAVVSNSPVETTRRSGDRKTVTFRPTPPLSTYLVALAVGPLQASRPVKVDGIPIRIWHVPGSEGLTRFGLNTAKQCLARLQAYFDVPYPYEKLDLVAVPDFEIGAMENAGAVFFRETLLLLDDQRASLEERKRAAEVICHELAHMWYGNLVTMAWWDDLWLNEAFATWMAFHIVDAWKPEWKMWLDFAHGRDAAMHLDGLRTTHPIYAEVRTPEDATESFDLITYEKGAAVVRMLERYLGTKTFRDGVRRYIRRHQEGNTRAHDLWKALGEASGENVAKIARAWIEQPGFPLVRVQRVTRDGNSHIELRQERFQLSDKKAPVQPSASGRWPVPWVGRVGVPGRGKSREMRFLLTKGRDRISLPQRTRFVYGNADESGFYHPLHEPDELEALAEHVHELPAAERMGLLTHQWSLVRAAHGHVDGFLELAEAYAAEEEPDVLSTLSGPLNHIHEYLAPAAGDHVRGVFEEWLGDCFGPQLDALGWDPAARESADVRVRRAAIVQILGLVAESEAVVNEAEARCKRYLAGKHELAPDLAEAIVRMGARRGDAKRHAAYLKRSRQADSPQERRRFRLGLAEFREPELVRKTLQLTLQDAIPTQDTALVLVRLLGNRYTRAQTWQFIKKRWPRLRKRMPTMLVGRLIEATPALQTPTHRKDVAAFFKAHPVPTAGRALRQSQERFKLNEALRKREARPLRRWAAAVSRG